jgi:hypothetical protein
VQDRTDALTFAFRSSIELRTSSPVLNIHFPVEYAARDYRHLGRNIL